MKMKITTAAILGVCLATANAATISLTNSDTPDFTAIVDSTGTSAITSGIIAVGTFMTEPVDVGSILGGNFLQAGNSIGFNPAAPSFFSDNVNVALANGDAFVGNQVYVVIGNGSTFDNSTELGVFKALSNTAGNTFTPDAPSGGPDLVTVTSTKGSFIIGSLNPAFTTAGFGSAPAFQLAAVPEPSALLLSAFGVLGLLRRRR